MTERLKQVFGVLWRVSILLLPWQTRWMFPISLGGWNWEQGSWSVYVSWFALVLAVVVGWIVYRPEPSFKKKKVQYIQLAILLAVSLGVTRFDGLALRAVVQWWLMLGILWMFFSSIRRAKVPVDVLIQWLALSLLPHALLACWQYAIQNVLPSKWLGIAAHDPRNFGVSVVEHDDFRVLRVYGGFSHPNIFGGWLAMAITLLVWRVGLIEEKWRVLFWSVLAAIFSSVLVLTYSRSAWLAVGVGSAASLICHFRPSMKERVNRQSVGIAVVCMALLAAPVFFTQRVHVFARSQFTNRLEAQSNSSRWESLRDGWRLFLNRPLLGTGPNAELVLLSQIHPIPKNERPLESPHSAWVLVLVSFGLVGCVLIGWMLWSMFRRMPLTWPILLPALVLGLLDHYLWSYWAGLCLAGFLILLLVRLTDEKHEGGRDIPGHELGLHITKEG